MSQLPDSSSPTPPTAQPAAQGAAPASKGLAITSMSLGIAAAALCVTGPIAFLMGLAAVITGVKTLSNQRPGRTQAWVGIGCGAFGMLLGVIATIGLILFPALGQARRVAKMSVSMSHAKEIGFGLMMYTADYKDYLPEPGTDLSRRLASYVPNPKVFVSPNDPSVTPAYIYVPRGRISRADPSDVLLYENPEIPALKWAVVYVDGHVEAKSKQELEAIIAGIKQKEQGGK